MGHSILPVLKSYSQEKYHEFQKENSKLIHYTTSEALVNILKNKTFWLRNTLIMNDKSEISHGTKSLFKFIYSDASRCFFEHFNSKHKNFEKHLKEKLNDSHKNLLRHTYIGCFSKYPNDEQSADGRLSMWRGYGGRNGVAVVINPVYLSTKLDVGAFTYPVWYRSSDQAISGFQHFCDFLVGNTPYELSDTLDELVYIFLDSFETFACITKHPAFLEECEWRLVFNSKHSETEYLTPLTVSINGLSQIVYEVPLDIEDSDEIHPRNLIEKVIIGPCEHPNVIADAIAMNLQEFFGKDDVRDFIHITDIPYRHS